MHGLSVDLKRSHLKCGLGDLAVLLRDAACAADVSFDVENYKLSAFLALRHSHGHVVTGGID